MGTFVPETRGGKMKIQSMSVDYGTLEMVVKFTSADDMRSTADSILNSGAPTKVQTDQQIRLLCDANKFIEAIRYHYYITNSSLKDSKEYCERIRDGKV
jgi:hypothetical protein